MSDSILTLNNVSKSYANFQLKDISFEVPKGCIVGLVGENGAGKSTIIKSILNLVHPNSGEIRIFNQSNTNSQLKEDIGIVFDDCNFTEEMNAAEVNSVMRSIYKRWDEATFHSIMKKFGMDEKQKIKEYSRGMKMKISIATALSHNAKLLVLDEATSGLDPVVRDDVLDVLLEFIQDEEHGILISSHIISDLEKACDYIVFIHEGKVFFKEQKDELKDKFVIAKCTTDEFKTIPKESIEAYRDNSFGVEVLIKRNSLPKGINYDKATIEEIMLFYIKGKKEN